MIRFDTSKPHRIVVKEKRGTCKFCCRHCTSSKEAHPHVREGYGIYSFCETCGVYLCSDRMRYPGIEGCEKSTCHTLYRTLEEVPAFWTDLDAQEKLGAPITLKQFLKYRATERKGRKRSVTTTPAALGSKENTPSSNRVQMSSRQSPRSGLTKVDASSGSTPRKRVGKRKTGLLTTSRGKRRDPKKETPQKMRGRKR